MTPSRSKIPACIVAAIVVVVVAACTPPPRPDAAVTECRALFVEVDARAARAGVEDHGLTRIPGFDYLRSNRLLASFRDEPMAPSALADWIEHLRELDLAARRVELANLRAVDVATLLAQFDACGRRLAADDRADPRQVGRLRGAAAVPDEYSLARRVFGLYPLAVPFMSAGVRGFHHLVERDYARPVEYLDTPGPLVEWRPPAPAAPVAAPEAAAWLAQTDALGIPRLSAEQRARLLETHAPSFVVETGGAYDRPGRVVIRNGVAAVDAAAPQVYTLTTFTRFHGKVLPQLVYTLWFPERPKASAYDPYAGWLDGVVWRVTLDTDGKPLVHDTIHPCGCFHFLYPARDLAARKAGGLWREPVLMPQGRVSDGRVAVRVQSATHYVRRVVAAASANAMENQRYTLADYAELQLLPDGRGGTRSLFGEGGLVEGSQRGERFWLWVSGVVSPGAMRQWGRHATAFVGTRHFDDPRLLEDFFTAGP